MQETKVKILIGQDRACVCVEQQEATTSSGDWALPGPGATPGPGKCHLHPVRNKLPVGCAAAAAGCDTAKYSYCTRSLVTKPGFCLYLTSKSLSVMSDRDEMDSAGSEQSILGNNCAGGGPRLPSTTMGRIISRLWGRLEPRSFPFLPTGPR